MLGEDHLRDVLLSAGLLLHSRIDSQDLHKIFLADFSRIAASEIREATQGYACQLFHLLSDLLARKDIDREVVLFLNDGQVRERTFSYSILSKPEHGTCKLFLSVDVEDDLDLAWFLAFATPQCSYLDLIVLSDYFRLRNLAKLGLKEQFSLILCVQSAESIMYVL
jgi:hypothetical protein